MFVLKSLAIGSATAVLIAMGAPAARAVGPVDDAPSSYAANTSGSSANPANSTDWSGWDVTGSTYKSVSAAWTVPTVTCAAGETSYSADWVGLDGDGSNSVEQTGTGSDCNSGMPVYSAWYEFYPSASVTLRDTVKPGDKISASVVSIAGTDQFTLVLTDSTAKWTKTQTGSSPSGTGASAEIIAEAPSGAEQDNSVLPLADFQTVTFSGVLVNGSKLGGAVGAEKIAMVDDYDNPMATVSALTGSDKFTVSWVSSGDSTGIEQSASDQGSPSGSGGYGWPGAQSGADGYGIGGYGSGSAGGYGSGSAGGYGSGSAGGYGNTTGGYGMGSPDGWGYSGGWGDANGSGDATSSNGWTDVIGEGGGGGSTDSSGSPDSTESSPAATGSTDGSGFGNTYWQS